MTDSITAHIAGVDEAGRGPLAGPVVVAAVILDPARPIKGLNDSKKLSARQRGALFETIRSHALAFSIVEISHQQIDAMNILQATLLGMSQAVAGLKLAPERVLIDGNQVPQALAGCATAIVGGDATEPSISAASILAKVHRDRLMNAMDTRFPGYGFAKHKGYPTPEHLNALELLGPCEIHRRSYAPVAAYL
jgi:ribonuclease HII